MWQTALAVLGDRTTAADAIAALRPYADSARAAISRRAGPIVLWYLFRVGDVRAAARTAAAGVTIGDALGLDRVTPVATIQASAVTSEPAASLAIVLDGDTVVGVREPGAPGAPGAGAEPAEEDELAWGGRPEVGFRGARTATPQPASDVVTVFYGTDRAAEKDPTVAPYFGGERGQLSFGTAEVSIPTARPRGTIPRPSWLRLELNEDPALHVMVRAVTPRSRDEFLADVRAQLAGADRRTALIFVHGYNVSFADGLRRVGQLAYDLRTGEEKEFPGLPMLYSWPSQANALRYLTDETNVRDSQPHFQEFLKLALTEAGVESVCVIAHSMGSRALLDCLGAFDTTTLPAGSAKLEHVILAAPDFDADTLGKLSKTLAGRARRYTLYASSEDLALAASRKVRSGLRRAGQSGDDILVVEGIDTIDASHVDTSLLGHGYFGERTVLSDIFALLRDGKSPDERYGLRPRIRIDRRYWEFAP